jgi:peptide/nickel transport system permease protein
MSGNRKQPWQQGAEPAKARRGPREAAAGAIVLGLVAFAALAAPWIAPFDPHAQQISQRLAAPGATHWLGTDGLGRDILSRLIYGARPTLGLIALVGVLSAPLGLAAGIAAGTYGGAVERALMGLANAVMAFPQLVLALAFVGVLGPGLFHSALALALTGWPAYARLARTQARVVRASDFFAAAQMAGLGPARLLFGQVLPCCLPYAQVRLALDMASVVLAGAGLGFLGLGVQPPTPEWGAMIAEGSKVVFDEWWVAASPGAAILLTSLGCHLLADGLRDAADPHRD